MLDKKYLAKIRKQITEYTAKRREIVKIASDILHWSKKAIFAIQRDDLKLADQLLAMAGQAIKALVKKHQKDGKVLNEGSYKACLEEYVEAVVLRQFIAGGKIGQLGESDIDADTYIGGLCDVPGELLRYAIKSATERNFVMVKKCHSVAEEIMGETMDMNLTGYNRQKFDQAKQALHKLQQVVYEVGLRG